MTREELIKLIQDNTMDTKEAIEYLGISKQRFSNLKTSGKIYEVKTGIFLRSDIEKRKEEQGELRKKYYRGD